MNWPSPRSVKVSFVSRPGVSKMTLFRLNELGCPAFEEKDMFNGMNNTFMDKSIGETVTVQTPSCRNSDSPTHMGAFGPYGSDTNIQAALNSAMTRHINTSQQIQHASHHSTHFSTFSNHSSFSDHSNILSSSIDSSPWKNQSTQLYSLRSFSESHSYGSDINKKNNTLTLKTPLLICKRFSLTSVPAKKARSSVLP